MTRGPRESGLSAAAPAFGGSTVPLPWENAVMDRQGALDRILPSLNNAMLDDVHWPLAFGLIDDACGIKGNALVVGKGRSQEDGRIFIARFCQRGVRNEERESWYFDNYYPHDERVPRVAQLPDGELAHMADLYTAEELKTSAAFNEALPRGGYQNGLNVRLEGPHGSSIVWVLADSLERGGWGSSQIEVIEYLLPHIRHYVRVRGALAKAEALGSSLTDMLDNTRVGVIHLGPNGNIVAANDRVREILRRGEGLLDGGGRLSAWLPPDNTRLKEILAGALRTSGDEPAGGSTTIRRRPLKPPLTVHVSPLKGIDWDFGIGPVAALVLIVEHQTQAKFNLPNANQIDSALVSTTLGLTPAEGHVAAMLAQGETVRSIAVTTSRKESSIRWHLRQIFKKTGVSRQADLVRLVFALTEFSEYRR